MAFLLRYRVITVLICKQVFSSWKSDGEFDVESKELKEDTEVDKLHLLFSSL